MRASVLLDQVVECLDATVRELPSPQKSYDPIVKALASYVKNHRVNHQNIFEIVNIIWPDAVKMELLPREEANDWFSYLTQEIDEASFAVFRVVFPDNSSGVIVSSRGLSIDFEVLT